MRLVIVESPYAGDVGRNTRYLRAALRDCLLRGEAPFASHAIYTQPGVLDDTIPAEREHGIQAGFHWRKAANATVVYTDLGTSRGMQYGIADAGAADCPVEYRTIPEWETSQPAAGPSEIEVTVERLKRERDEALAWGRGLRGALTLFLARHTDCAGQGECICDGAWGVAGIPWGDVECARRRETRAAPLPEKQTEGK